MIFIKLFLCINLLFYSRWKLVLGNFKRDKIFYLGSDLKRTMINIYIKFYKRKIIKEYF